MAPRYQKVEKRIKELINGFPHYLHIFEEWNTFSRYGQMEQHLKTIQLFKQLGDIANVLGSQEYMETLYRTLESWGMNSRGAKLKPLPEFRAALISKADDIAEMKHLKLQDCQEPALLAERLWQIITNLEVSETWSKLVVGTKTLHHLLPNLVPPMDRAYTRVFFQWYSQMFQYGQSRFFSEVVPHFVYIAQNISLEDYVTGQGWRTSPTKLLDNAIIGYCLENRLTLA